MSYGSGFNIPVVVMQTPPQITYYPAIFMQQSPILIFPYEPTPPKMTHDKEKPKEENPKEDKPKEVKGQDGLPKKEEPKVDINVKDKPNEEKSADIEEISSVCIASIIFFSMALIIGIICIANVHDAYEVHSEYEESGNGLESGLLFDELQAAWNTTLATAAAALFTFWLAFTLIIWSAVYHRMRSKVKHGFWNMFILISGCILFTLTFLIDVAIIVLAYDKDRLLDPILVWLALIGHVCSWLLILIYSEMTRRKLGHV